jgi:hypothetical protein
VRVASRGVLDCDLNFVSVVQALAFL